MITFLKHLSTPSLLLAGALVGLTLSACDFGPKNIGKETQGDKECEDGDTMPSDDGCNTCTCTDGGWACTEKASDGPVACEDGESKPAGDGCNTCSCEDGNWLCTEIGCPNECQPGDVKMEECNSCECYEGGWVCTDAACPDPTGDTVDPTGADPTGDPTGDTADPTGADYVCGDGIVEGAEQCDDGNQIDDDACPNDCTLDDNVCGPTDPLTITAAAIVGDDLNVEVKYGGGCEEHVIGLCWEEAFAESDPVQTGIQLWHDANGDLCDALITEMRTIDLSSLRVAWQEGYQQEHGTIIVHLDGWDGGSLEYTF
jgi:cysteine-rich repeat protein